MAQMVTASIYGSNGNDYRNVAGVTQYFPVTNIMLKAISPAVSYAGVACNTAIIVLPTAPSPIQQIYYSPVATATIGAAAG